VHANVLIEDLLEATLLVDVALIHDSVPDIGVEHVEEPYARGVPEGGGIPSAAVEDLDDGLVLEQRAEAARGAGHVVALSCDGRVVSEYVKHVNDAATVRSMDRNLDE